MRNEKSKIVWVHSLEFWHLADFIHLDNKGIIITTNKAIATPDLNVIEKYIKKLEQYQFK